MMARRFGPGYSDLIVIDEAHRSVYRNTAPFSIFRQLIVGLTRRQGRNRQGYLSAFQPAARVPTDAYSLDEAVHDGFLVPPKAISVPLKFEREGIRYDDLSDEEKEAWDAVEWDEDGGVPAIVEPAAVNKWLFNADTVDKVLEHLMTHGQRVADGDRLGKRSSSRRTSSMRGSSRRGSTSLSSSRRFFRPRHHFERSLCAEFD